jgi:LysR family transcriptional regulator for metE and metH
VSQALTELERRLGVRLFHRGRRRMSPTAAGRRLADAATGVLEELRRLEEEVRGHASAAVGSLRITTECYTCYHWLPAALGELQQKFPEVQLELVPEATRVPIPALLDGRVDLAIVYSQVADRRLQQLPLIRDELVAVVAPDHRLAARSYLTPRDLAGEHLLLHVEPERSTVVREFLAPSGIEARRISTLQLTEAVLETARAGMGVALVARWAAAPLLRAGALRAVRLGRRGLVRQWWATRRAAEPGASRLRLDPIAELVEILRRSGPGVPA